MKQHCFVLNNDYLTEEISKPIWGQYHKKIVKLFCNWQTICYFGVIHHYFIGKRRSDFPFPDNFFSYTPSGFYSILSFEKLIFAVYISKWLLWHSLISKTDFCSITSSKCSSFSF